MHGRGEKIRVWWKQPTGPNTSHRFLILIILFYSFSGMKRAVRSVEMYIYLIFNKARLKSQHSQHTLS